MEVMFGGKERCSACPQFLQSMENEKWAAVGAVIYENKKYSILGEKTTG